MIFDSLREILSATNSLGFLPMVKVTGEEDTTELDSIAADKTVVLHSKFIQPVDEFNGVFGLCDLGKLNTIISIPEYLENACITIKKQNKNGTEVPVEIDFENEGKDFRNSFRLMSRDIVEEQIPTRNRKEIQWNVEIVPTLSAIQRLKYQSSAVGSSDGTFSIRTVEKNLLFSLGDHSSHEGEFKFADNISGKIKTPREWPLTQVQAILGMAGDKILRISDAGAMEIEVTSGMAIHAYTILSSAK